MRCPTFRLLAVGCVAVFVATASCWAGDADDEKLDCANAMSTRDMNLCAGQEFEKADAALNAYYSKALAAIPGMASEKPYDALRVAQSRPPEAMRASTVCVSRRFRRSL